MTPVAAIAPREVLPFGERVAEWAGPLVVKEVRAGLKSWAFAVAFGLMLLVGFVVVLTSALVPSSVGEPRGPAAFMGTAAAFAVYGQLLMPFIALRAMVREREDETWVLLVLTGLGTDGIVRGKHLAALVQLGLGAAAMAPFMLLSYLLSGIGLTNVVLGVVWHLSLAFLLVSAGLGLGAQSETRLERTVSHFVILAASVALGGLSMVLTGALAFNGERLLREGEAIGLLVGVPVVMVLLGWCVQPAAAAALALDSEAKTHAARARVGWTMLLVVVTTMVLALVLDANRDVVCAISVLNALVLLVVGFFAVSERAGYPKSTADDGFARPGALRSTMVAFGLLALSATAFGAVAAEGNASHTALTLASPGFVLLYLSLGVLLGRLTPLKKLGARNGARAGFLVATLLGIAVPTAFAAIADKRPDRGPGWFFNPFFGMVHFIDRRHLEAEAALLAGVAALAGVVALLVLYGEDGVRTHEQ
jgi:hypothetical protein